MPTTIVAERPDTAEARALIEELERQLAPFYPTESRHGYSVDRLLKQGVAFFVVRHDGAPAGCGGVQLFGREYGELKRMYVRDAFRGKGFGRLILDHLVSFTAAQGVGLLRLETGIHQTAAIGLYERAGFKPTGPFGEYKDDPLSVFFEKPLR